MTAREVLDGIKGRLEAASAEMDRLTNGSPGHNWRWSIPARPERDSDLLLSAPLPDVARLTAAVESVLALHKPEKRWMPYDGADISFDTQLEAALYANGDDQPGAGVTFFEVCAHCKHIEDSPCEGECTREAGYRESLWPCPTVAAIENTLELV